MTTLIGEQRREIGMMKAIGGTRRQIRRVYLRTALLLGAVGSRDRRRARPRDRERDRPLLRLELLRDLARLRRRRSRSSSRASSSGWSRRRSRRCRRSAAVSRIPVREGARGGARARRAARRCSTAPLRRLGFLPRTAQIGVRSVTRRGAAQPHHGRPDRARGRHAARGARARQQRHHDDERRLEPGALGRRC